MPHGIILIFLSLTTTTPKKVDRKEIFKQQLELINKKYDNRFRTPR
jgi:hypothetical protein